MRIVKDIKKDIYTLKSACVEGVVLFDKAKEALEKEGYRIISLEENARLRIEEGPYKHVTKRANYVREGVIYIPKKGRFITKNSPILNNSKEAVQANLNRKRFYITDEQVEKALADSVQVPYNKREIPTCELGKDEVGSFIFGEVAEEYGRFLIEKFGYWSINYLSLRLEFEHLVNKEKTPFATQLFFNCVSGTDCDENSEIFDNSLGSRSPVRGILYERT